MAITVNKPATFTIAGKEFKSIEKEEYRLYIYPDMTIRIDKPKGLYVNRKDDGTTSHYVLDQNGESWYIHPGWRALRWKCPEGEEFLFIGG